jgi:GNAT superfamily N-acetyltransferase
MSVPFTVEAMPPGLDTGGFRCEAEGKKDDIGDYLTQGDAEHDQQAGFSRAFIVRDSAGEIIAYYSLQADSVKLVPGEIVDVPYKSAPAIKVARIGVRFDQRGQGVGSKLLKYIESEVLLLAEQIGVRFITLDAVSDQIDWYRKRGYVFMLEQAQKSSEAEHESGDRSMYRDLGWLSERPILSE